MSTSSLGAQLKVGIQMEPIQERVRKTTERLEADFSKIKTKIHRFPPGLRGIGNHYIIPSFVALGPYHHGSAHLLEAEELKHAAAQYFCSDSCHTLEQVYTKILSIAGEARGLYADDAVARFGDAEFGAMMFLDGCFVLQYINGFGLENSVATPLWKNRTLLSTGPCMLRDIFLVENQIPWLVLDALMTIRYVPVYRFVARMFLSFEASTELSMDQFQRYSPPHLLGLLWYYQIGGRMVPQEHVDPRKSSSLGSSAFELAEIGVKLTAANKPWFVDMSFRRGHLFSELPLMPLFLNNVSACWLVNLAAFEACTSTSRWPSDGFVVSSYLSLLAMLMDKEESVHELRAKHLLRSFFSDHEVLVFFKGLSHHLHLGNRYLVIAEKIEEFKRERPVRIALHKFVYNNFKTIAALLSIASMLVGIFTTLMSLEQQQQQH